MTPASETVCALERPSVSIIIPTHNRSRNLSRALASLADLDYPSDRFEVVVVDDGSSDDTSRVVLRHWNKALYRLRYFRLNHRGITAARNVGWQGSRGIICIFTDDDCTFPKDWLSRILPLFSFASVGAVGGPDKGPPGQGPFARCVDYAMNSFWGTGGVRRKAGTRIARYYPRGCNIAVPRYVLLLTGGFDATLAAGEEIELGCRIRKWGFDLCYAPDAFVWHNRRETFSAYARQILTRGQTRAELIWRHRELWEPAYLLPALALLVSPLVLLLLGSSGHLLQAFCLLSPWFLGLFLIIGLDAFAQLRIPRAVWLAPALVFIQHILYGAGTLLGLWHRLLQPAAKYPSKI